MVSPGCLVIWGKLNVFAVPEGAGSLIPPAWDLFILEWAVLPSRCYEIFHHTSVDIITNLFCISLKIEELRLVRWDLLSLRLLTGVKYSPVLTEPHLSFSSVPMAGVNLPSASGIRQGFNTLLTLRDLPFWAPQHRFFYACQINIFPDDKYCLTSSFPVKGLENNSSSSYTIHPASSQIQNRLISLCSSKFMLFLSLCCASHRFSQLLRRDSDLQFITSNTH